MSSRTDNSYLNLFINDKNATPTLRGLQQNVSKLRNEWMLTTVGTEDYEVALKKLSASQGLLARHKAEVSEVGGAWSEIKSQFSGFFKMFAIGGAISLVVAGFRKIVDYTKEVREGLRELQMSSGMTSAEIQDLNKQLSKISTKTAQVDLIKLADTAVKQGIKGTAAITAWVAEADKINRVMGPDLGEDGIKQLDVLSKLFGVSAINIASSLKVIDEASAASVPYQLQFLQGVSAIGKEVNVSAADLEGYGAAFENLAQDEGQSAMALNKLFLGFNRDTEKFGDVAGYAKGELQKLIGEKGTNEGFLEYLTKLKDSSTSTEDFLAKLKELGLGSVRGASAIIALANNTKMVADQQVIANKAMKDGTAIQEAFSVSENTFGATMSRLWKGIENGVSSALIPLGDAIAKVADLRSETEKLTGKWMEQKAAGDKLESSLTPLINRYFELKNNTHKSKDEQVELQDVINQIASLMPSAVTGFDNYGRAISISTDKVYESISANKQLQEILMADTRKSAEKDIADLEAKRDNLLARINDMNAGGSSDMRGVGVKDRIDKDTQDLLQNNAQIVQSYLDLQKYGDLTVQQQYNLQVAARSAGVSLDDYFGTSKKDAAETQTAVEDLTTATTDSLDTTSDKAKTATTDAYGNIEDVMQQIWLMSQDELTKALASSDQIFENAINKLTDTGKATDSEFATVYDAWGKATDAIIDKHKILNTEIARGWKQEKTIAVQRTDSMTTWEHTLDEIHIKVKAVIDATKDQVAAYTQAGVSAVEGAKTQKEAINATINAIRSQIKAVLAQALAEALASALGSVPFPFNIILATAAGAAASALFDKIIPPIPQAAEGGYADMVGAGTGKTYHARVMQNFSGGYVPNAMLVGEEGAEWTAPSWMMGNPYTVKRINELETIRKAGPGATEKNNSDNNQATGQVSTGNDALMNEMIKVIRENKEVMDDIKKNGIAAFLNDGETWRWQKRTNQLNEVDRKSKA